MEVPGRGGDTALRGLTPVIRGTREWTYFERPNIVVPSDRTAVLKLEAYREPSGHAWFDDVRVEEQLPTPLDVFVLHPSYRGMLFEDESQTMRFDVAVHPPGGDVAPYRVRGTLREEESGAVVSTRTWSTSRHIRASASTITLTVAAATTANDSVESSPVASIRIRAPSGTNAANNSPKIWVQ